MDLEDGDSLITATQIKKDADYEVVVATTFGTFKKVDLGTIGKLARARKGVRLVDVGSDGKESALLATPIEEGENVLLLCEDENGNVMHADSDDIFLESRTTKGKTLPSLGIFRAKGVYSFRPLVPKK